MKLLCVCYHHPNNNNQTGLRLQPFYIRHEKLQNNQLNLLEFLLPGWFYFQGDKFYCNLILTLYGVYFLSGQIQCLLRLKWLFYLPGSCYRLKTFLKYLFFLDILIFLFSLVNHAWILITLALFNDWLRSISIMH